jgi:hypothetical protein
MNYSINQELAAVQGIIDNGGNQFAKSLIIRKIALRVEAVDGIENAIDMFDLTISEARLLRAIITVA